MQKKNKLVILNNELPDDHDPWVKACQDYLDQVEYRVVDLTSNNWLSEVQQSACDHLLAMPGGITTAYKQLYDERIYVLNKVLGLPVFPSYEEIFIYENKRLLSYWLQANQIPHPSTQVFYNLEEASLYIKNCRYPLVAKTNIGAAGSGVKMLRTFSEANVYIKDIFSGRGAAKRTGPNLARGGLLKRGFHYVIHPGDIKKKLSIYNAKKQDVQTGFVIFQEYIDHSYEWRVVRIGHSFFAHKKLKTNEKASGSLLKGYENPPLKLLDFVKEITDRHGFFSQALDIFETKDGKYLVNEVQCIFGQSDPYQMLVDGKPGRYVMKDYQWVFEEGDFARNQCYHLRVEFVLRSLK